MKRKEIKPKCPDGYLPNCGQVIDMLGKTELWKIHEHHAEPEITRIPQDLVDYGIGLGQGAKRVPKEWGRCLYYRVI